MNNKHDIDTYSKLAEAANFYLEESFRHINNALISELSGILFENKIEKINLTRKDHQIVSKIEFTENPLHLLQTDFGDVLTDKTIQRLADAWHSAQLEAENQLHEFPKNHTINSIELLGHINYLAFFLETLTNRHLLFLHQTKAIDNFTYNNLSIAKTLNRLIFICKTELETNKLQLNEIANLFSLRNKTVHYTPENALSFRTDIASLIRIWNQIIKLLKIFERREKFIDDVFSILVSDHITDFKSNWTK